MYNVVFRYIWEPEESSEIVQEAFVRVWKMRHRVTLDRWRGASASPAMGEVLDEHRVAIRLRAGIDALPESLRVVVMMKYFSGMTNAEIGSVLDIPAGTVGSRHNRAKQQLRLSMGDQNVR